MARVEIDTSAIRSNLLHIQRTLAADGDPELCAVLKADAYGHGINSVLPVLMSEGVEIVGIASNEEARQVRSIGFTGRLLRVRAAAPKEISGGVSLGIEEWVGGFLHARTIADIALARQTEIPVHLATNAPGISKEALDLERSGGEGELTAMVALRGLNVRGVCAHFPCEDEGETRRGLQDFLDEAAVVTSKLGSARSSGVQRHCATSFASLMVPESRLELVRVGAALYGDSSASVRWQRGAMRVVAPISTVNHYPAGRTVGYEKSVTLERDSVIATIPLGYGDGISRTLGKTGNVLVRGRRAPIVDLISMCSLAVDVTDIPRVRPGDEAVLLGSQGAQSITPSDIAKSSGAIAAASYTTWGRVIPRFLQGAPEVSTR